MFLVAPIYVYLLGGFIFGWTGGRITAPSGMPDWRPDQHANIMVVCKKMCGGRVLNYDTMTGECTCRRST